eukprot:6893965-Pyramimonas_sp.AAC.1
MAPARSEHVKRMRNRTTGVVVVVDRQSSIVERRESSSSSSSSRRFGGTGRKASPIRICATPPRGVGGNPGE